jgi:hypothetical protein
MRPHALPVLLTALAAPLAAQLSTGSVASFLPLDECGGQPAFLGSSYIVEESMGFCGGVNGATSVPSTQVPLSGIALVSGNYVLTASASSTVLAQLQTTDTVYINGTSAAAPTCLTRSQGFAVVYATSTTVTIATCGGGPTPTLPSSPVLYGAYGQTTGPGPRFELKLVQDASGWSSPSVTLLSTGTNRSALGFASNCSLGNPSGYYDGTNYYLAFLVQNTTTCGQSNSPSKGTQYDLWACNLGSSPTTAMTSSNCGYIQKANTNSIPGQGAILDPHIFPPNMHIYVSERDNSSVYSIINGGSPGYDVWSVDDISVSWTGTPSQMGIGTYVFNAGGWSTPAGRDRASNDCEQYYKLTGLIGLPAWSATPTVRAFFQANDINPGGTSPFTNYYSGLTCDTMGAGKASDFFVFSGLFYADLDGTVYSGTVLSGSHYTQFYPTLAATSGPDSCTTPGLHYAHCYGEFPWMFHSGTSMIFIANTVTQAALVDICGPTAGCKENYPSEVVQALVATDFSQSSLPMTLLGFPSFSNIQAQGTLNCQQILSIGNTSVNCGLAASGGPYFGNCGHLDVDEASQYVTCSGSTNIYNPGYSSMGFNFDTDRTMVFSLGPSILSPVTQLTGSAAFKGGAAFHSQ